MRLPSLDADRIEARTPADRDRYADLLRLTAIVVVVLGHWLVGVIRTQDGAIQIDRLIAVVPATQPLTWLFQVMPLFFLIGGAVNAGSWCRAQERGEPWAVWLRRRSRRLLRPLLPVLALWLPLTVVLRATPVPEGWVAAAIDNALLPVWFLAVYLLAIALVPVTWALHRRFGLGVLVAAVVATGLVDVLHRAEVPVVGFANYLLVWAGAHQVGYLWYEDRLPRAPGRPARADRRRRRRDGPAADRRRLPRRDGRAGPGPAGQRRSADAGDVGAAHRPARPGDPAAASGGAVAASGHGCGRRSRSAAPSR
jgi:hypothetical protein